jgi:hypothetical protein
VAKVMIVQPRPGQNYGPGRCRSAYPASDDVAIILMLLHAEAGGGQLEITSERGPYPNRHEPGLRIYVTLRLPAAEGGPRDMRAARLARSAVTFDLSDGDTYFVLTEALLDFAARERANAADSDPQFRTRLAALSDGAVDRIDALLRVSRGMQPQAGLS